MTTAFEFADQFVDDVCAIDTTFATSLGISGSDDRWGSEFGLRGAEGQRELRARNRPLLEPYVESRDVRERLAARIVREVLPR